MTNTIPCGNPRCKGLGTRKCSGCNNEGYCGPECQKIDWKVHRIICSCMKSGDKLLKFSEVTEKLREPLRQLDLKGLTEAGIRLMEFCLSFAEYQFGVRRIGKSSRMRDGEGYDNWQIDILLLENLCMRLSTAYMCLSEPMDMNDIGKGNLRKAIHYCEKSLLNIEPWRIQIFLKEDKRIDSLDKGKIDLIFERLSMTERYLSECHMRLRDYVKAESHADKGISYAKLIIIEEERVELLSLALRKKARIFYYQFKYKEAQLVYEEMYNALVEVYQPDHPKVLAAANQMIQNLIDLKEFGDAERYARISYDCLTRPVDTESIGVAHAAMALADVTYKLICESKQEGWNMLEAEMLARKAIRIYEKIYGHDNLAYQATAFQVLSKILTSIGNHDIEAKDLFEKALSIYVDSEGTNGHNVAIMNYQLGLFHLKMAMADKATYGTAWIREGAISKIYWKEAIRINTKLHGPTHDQTLQSISMLSGMIVLGF